jgi:hypothetical protein
MRLSNSGAKAMLLACFLASGIAVSGVAAQSAHTPPSAQTTAPHSPYKPNHVPKREAEYFGMVWGVDSLSVKAVESGELIRFSYRIVNPEKAKILNDKKMEAFLVSPANSVRLVIPSLEKVGQLRQTNAPEAGRSYWMAFSNPRRTVKRGDHVNVDIGQFHVSGLVVE